MAIINASYLGISGSIGSVSAGVPGNPYAASGTPAGSCPLTVSTPAGANDCTITNTENAATLTVNKVYSGTDAGPVAITLACGANGTIDPPNPANAATGSPAVFTVHGYTPRPYRGQIDLFVTAETWHRSHLWRAFAGTLREHHLEDFGVDDLFLGPNVSILAASLQGRLNQLQTADGANLSTMER